MSKNSSDRLAQCAKQYARLKADLQTVGYVCVGSVQSRRLRCGSPACRCHQDDAYRHGPYHYWTRKVGGKTISVILTEHQMVLYREWIDNNRALERIVRLIREVSLRALKSTVEPKAR